MAGGVRKQRGKRGEGRGKIKRKNPKESTQGDGGNLAQKREDPENRVEGRG